MKLTFRTVAVAVAVAGFGLGVSFAAGVAYGRGTPKTVAAAPTQQQLNAQLGVSGSGGTQALATQAAGSGAQRGQGQGLGRSALGRITAMEGNTITIETAQGSQKIALLPNAQMEKVSPASLADFKVGDTIVASGSRSADGTFEATAVSQVPQGLSGALAGAGAPSSQPAATPTGR